MVAKHRPKKNELFFFLHCRTSARHGRSTSGISMRLKSNFPGRKKPTRNKTNQKQATPTHKPRHGPGKSAREICKLSETRWNIRAPLSPSNVLVHRVVLLHVVQCLDVSHINICTWVLRRVSYVWLQTSSLELIRALSSLPPFCTILHECINFRLRYCFLVW